MRMLLVEKYQKRKLREVRPEEKAEDADSSGSDVDELLEELENDDETLFKYRETRMEELRRAMRGIDRAAADFGENLGKMQVFTEERPLMDAVTSLKSCLVHFFHPEFARCRQMNDVLRSVAESHVGVRVFAIEASKAEFLVARMKIKVLPFVVAYQGGQEAGRLVGFEGVGQDHVTQAGLEAWMARVGLIGNRLNF